MDSLRDADVPLRPLSFMEKIKNKKKKKCSEED